MKAKDENLCAGNHWVALAPICSLPVEILQSVFMLDVERAYRSFENRKLVASMLRLTHVCAFWRVASLNFSQMWFPVVLFKSGDNWDLANMFLERGILSPLRLSNIRSPSPSFSFPPRLRSHTSRIEEIRLDTTIMTCSLAFRDIGSHFPILRHLEIYYNPDIVEDDPFDPDTSVIKIEAPNVKRLLLENVHISSLNSFKDLTRIYISSLKGLLARDFVNVLSRSPSLRSLEILESENFFQPDSLWEMDTTIIALPQLEYVFLYCLENLLYPFCKLLFPSVGPRTSFRIVEEWDRADYVPILDIARKTVWIFNGPKALSCKVRSDPDIMEIITFPKTAAAFSISLRWSMGFERVLLSDRLELSRLKNLSINTIDGKFLSILPRLPHLRWLALRDPGKEHLEAYILFQRSSICPELEVLRISFTEDIPKYNDLMRWIFVCKARIENGCRRLDLLSLFVPEPERHSNFDLSYGVADKILIQRLDQDPWDEWE